MQKGRLAGVSTDASQYRQFMAKEWYRNVHRGVINSGAQGSQQCQPGQLNVGVDTLLQYQGVQLPKAQQSLLAFQNAECTVLFFLFVMPPPPNPFFFSQEVCS